MRGECKTEHGTKVWAQLLCPVSLSLQMLKLLPLLLAVLGIRGNLQKSAVQGLIDTPKIHIFSPLSFSDLISESETREGGGNNSLQAI